MGWNKKQKKPKEKKIFQAGKEIFDFLFGTVKTLY